MGDHDAGQRGPRGRPGVRSNLPAEISTFVGRAEDLARCADLLRRGRLLTLTGAGGAGKTRLALRLAATLAVRFPGGIWWTDLAPLTGQDAVTEAVARAVPVALAADLDAMTEVLGDVEALLVLDNCEHLGGSVPAFVDRLLRGTRALRVLATSRGVLEVDGEIVWRVNPLVIPPAGTRGADMHRYDAAWLFLERAGRARPDVTPQAADVVAVCRQLDGLPLALELAAARFRTATMTQILAGLDDRFALLTRAGGTAPSRQRTLLASVQWSHDLLTVPAKVLLRRLAVFHGGWTLAAARTVTGFSPLEPGQLADLLAGLVDASMVQLEDAADAGRYRLLETIRAYAAARLADAGETGDLADRHLEWAADLAEGLEQGTAAADPSALAQLEAEIANVRAALDHAAGAASASQTGLRLVAALGFFWVHRGYALAGDDRATRVIDAAPDAPAWLRARALQAHAYTCFYGADTDTARTSARAALELAAAQPHNGGGPADPRTAGRAHQLLAAMELLDDPTASRRHLTAALPAARQAEDSWAEIEILQTFALSYLAQHRPALARPYLDQSRPLAEAAGHRVQLVWELILAGLCDTGDGSFTSAASLLEQGTAAARQVGDTMVELFAWAGLAAAELATGDLRRTAAIEAAYAGTDTCTGLVEHAVTALMDVAAAMTDPGKAAHALLDLADRPLLRVAGDQVRYRLAAAALLLRAGDPGAAEGAIHDALDRCEAIDSPLAGTCRIFLARLRRGDGKQAEAERLAQQGLAEIDSANLRPELPEALEVLGGLAVDAGRPADGLRLLTAAGILHRDMGQYCPFQTAVAADRERAAEALGSQAAEVIWQAEQLSIQAAISRARRGRGPRQRPDHGWDSLTPAEREVVQLVAEGLSNPDIASRLFISRATVKTHLTHVFTKLDVINRAQLVALATQAAAEGTLGHG